MPPCVAVHTVYIYQGKGAQEGYVGAAEQGMRMVRGYGCAEEDEDCREERGCGERGKEERQEGRL